MKALTPTATPEALTGDNPNVTLELLDALIDGNIRVQDLEQPLWLRRITAGKDYLMTTMRELDGADLEGKSVYAYFRNWGASEWVFSDGAISVMQEDGTYQFKYSKAQEDCRNELCGHVDEDKERLFSLAQSYLFGPDAEALVIWEKPGE